MLDKLESVAQRFAELNEQLSALHLKPADFIALNKERAQLAPLVETFFALKACLKEQEDNEQLLLDEDMEIREMAKAEIEGLAQKAHALESQLKVLLLPRDPHDEKNIILEIRGGTGGDEASLFAGELFQMYARFAETMRWKVELLSVSEGVRGGFKEVVASINGDQVFSWLKYEAGPHRVQRVPQTESQGRIHTSVVTVAILPEAQEIDVHIDEKDLRIDVFRAGGPGGQSVNTTDSAVRITHIPTGMVVQCQDEKSQLKNKSKALKVLRARLYEQMRQAQEAERAQERKLMVKGGDRSDKIRTYNFPQDRCTDHRIGLTAYNLPKLFSGDLAGFLSEIRAHFQASALKEKNE